MRFNLYILILLLIISTPSKAMMLKGYHKLITKPKKNINKQNIPGLYAAVQSDNKNLVKLALAQGTNPNQKYFYINRYHYKTVLGNAIENKQLDIIKILTKNGADLKLINKPLKWGLFNMLDNEAKNFNFFKSLAKSHPECVLDYLDSKPINNEKDKLLYEIALSVIEKKKLEKK